MAPKERAEHPGECGLAAMGKYGGKWRAAVRSPLGERGGKACRSAPQLGVAERDASHLEGGTLWKSFCRSKEAGA